LRVIREWLAKASNIEDQKHHGVPRLTRHELGGGNNDRDVLTCNKKNNMLLLLLLLVTVVLVADRYEYILSS